MLQHKKNIIIYAHKLGKIAQFKFLSSSFLTYAHLPNVKHAQLLL